MSTDGTMKAIISADNSEFKKVIQDTENTASSASAGLNKSFSGAGAGMETATQKSGFLNSSIGKIAAGVGAVQLVTKGIDVLKSSVGSAVGRFDTLNAYPKVMAQMGYSTQDVTKSVSVLKKGVDGLPTSLQDLTKSAQSFAILTGSATKGAQAASALNDAFIASGATAATAEQGTQDYSKMLAEGKVNMQDWNSVAGDMPLAMKQVANSFGLTGKSAVKELYNKLKAGDITMEQLNDRFIQLDGGAKGFAATARAASGGIGTSFTNMKNAVVNGLANTIQTINDSLKSAGLKNGIATIFDQGKQAIVKGFAVFNQLVKVAIPPIVATFKTLFDFVNQNKGWLKPLLIGIGSFAGAVKTINAVSKAMTTLKVISSVAKDTKLLGFALENMSKESAIAKAGLTAYKAATSAWSAVTKVATGVQSAFTAVMDANPIMLIVIAIAAVVAGLVYFFTQTKTGQKLWASFVKTLGSLWNSLVNIAKSVWSSITGAFNDSVKGIQNGWNGINSFFSNLWQGIVNTAVGIWNGFTSTLSGIWQGIVGTAVSIWNSFTSTLSSIWQGTVNTAQSVWGAITGFFSGLWNGIISVATNLWNTFGPALTTIWQGIVTVAKGVWEMLKAVIMAPILIVIDLITGGWNQLGSDLQLIWTSIVTAAQTIWTGLQTYFSGVLNLISTYFTTVWNLISSTAVAIWNGIVSTAQNIWNGLVSFMTNLWNGMVSTAVNTWNGLLSSIVSIANSIKDGAINTWNALVSGAINIWNNLMSGIINIANGIKDGAINAWNSLVSGVKNLINSLVNGAISTWNNLKSSVVSIANGIKDGAINAWNALVSGVQSIIDSVVNIFDTLKNINLLDIGQAIIDGFVNGLTGAWKKGMKFISGIGDWIREHKGPIREDRKLLIPAGNAIMGGFGSSLNNAFDSVKSNVLTYADQLSGAMNNVSFSGAIQKVSDFQSWLQNNALTAQTSIAGGNSSYSSEMSQDVLSAPSANITVEVHQEWDGDNVYSYVKNKDARVNAKIKMFNK